MFPELGGARAKLAENGWGFAASSTLGYAYDVLGHNESVQLYNGQSPTWNYSSQAMLTYDLSRIGFSPDAQFTVQGAWQGSNYRPAQPKYLTMQIFAITQSFLDHHLELQYGYFPVIRAYYGLILGGNASAAALGPSSVIPFQIGVSAFAPTPTFNAKLWDPSKHFYNSFGVTRSVSPDGFLADIDQNPTGFRLSVPGARALFIDEFGYKADSGPDTNSKWFRVGLIYNTSHYTDFKSGGVSSNNYGGYLAATYQLYNPDGTARGLYGDVKFDYAPSDRNLYTKDYQLTLFYLGPFKSRPGDMAAVGFTKNYFSEYVQSLVRSSGTTAAVGSAALTASYAARVSRGVYAVTGLTYTKNPNFAPTRANALIFQETLNLSF
ncbi:carbohydrate porin [Paraburkholderia metrosideri]|uniref:carbohydrate porin n=1 Tax=Paraburkholderia metrosideri TaxID=580937 RepID=UPI001918D32A|nr:carbohydrate porin [Paraburkholderia metrosideri]